jgi:hypothetical protein
MSVRPVVPGVESEDEWEAHRRGVFECFSPVGHHEQSYVYRIALLMWRLNRIVRYETRRSPSYRKPPSATSSRTLSRPHKRPPPRPSAS